MRIAIGQIWQETNTFNPLPTTRRDFEDFGVLRGPEVVERMAETNELGGFIQSLRRWPERPEIVGLVRLAAWPGGTATRATFEWLRQELLDALGAAAYDAVLLALHGALVAEGTPDVEGELLETVRGRIGARVPLVATLDLHCNLTEKMVRHADALVAYHTAPHIDVFETGERGAALLRRIVVDGVRPVTAFEKLPLVVPAERANTQDPASVSFELRRRLQELEQQPGILSAGLTTVQPWLDIPDLGSAVFVVTDNDPARARREATALADAVWGRRRDYLPLLTPVEEAVAAAHRLHGEGLIVLSDSADATTSGAPGDSTWVLRELLRHDWQRPALVTLVAPEVVEEAARLGVGASWAGALGGKRDARFSQPLTLSAEIVRFFDARFTLSGHLAKNLPIDMGRGAVLRHGSVHIVLTSRSGPHFAPALFEAAGLAPFSAGVLVAKSPCGFRAAYQERARQIMLVRAPGCAPSDFWRYEYRHIPRPLWPWDEIETRR